MQAVLGSCKQLEYRAPHCRPSPNRSDGPSAAPWVTGDVPFTGPEDSQGDTPAVLFGRQEVLLSKEVLSRLFINCEREEKKE